MAIELKVFYSWQSDLPNNTNRGFIQKALEDAAKDIASDVTTDLEPVIDRDTSGVPGSPDIRQTIFAKIESCDVFVADVSIICAAPNRAQCNPNVLIELGYALKCLGDDRVLLVQNASHGRAEDLPFDLRGRRVISYATPSDEVDKSVVRRNLARTLGAALRMVGHTQKEAAENSRRAEIERLSQLAEDFRSQRISAIEARRLPVRLISEPLVAIHAMPLESFKSEREFDVRTLISLVGSRIWPMGPGLTGHSATAPTEDGVITTGRGDANVPPFENSYTVVRRNGVIEAVRAGLIVRNPQTNLVTFFRYEEAVLHYVRQCFEVLSALQCFPPVLVAVSLFGVGGAQLAHPGDRHGIPSSRSFQNDTIALPSISFNDFSENVGGLLKCALDRAWQQVGHLSSPFLDDNGTWVGIRP